jgi:hypothetical protein
MPWDVFARNYTTLEEATRRCQRAGRRRGSTEEGDSLSPTFFLSGEEEAYRGRKRSREEVKVVPADRFLRLSCIRSQTPAGNYLDPYIYLHVITLRPRRVSEI